MDKHIDFIAEHAPTHGEIWAQIHWQASFIPLETRPLPARTLTRGKRGHETPADQLLRQRVKDWPWLKHYYWNTAFSPKYSNKPKGNKWRHTLESPTPIRPSVFKKLIHQPTKIQNSKHSFNRQRKERHQCNPKYWGLLKEIPIPLGLHQSRGINKTTYNNFEKGAANISIKMPRKYWRHSKTAAQKNVSDETKERMKYFSPRAGDVRWENDEIKKPAFLWILTKLSAYPPDKSNFKNWMKSPIKKW